MNNPVTSNLGLSFLAGVFLLLSGCPCEAGPFRTKFNNEIQASGFDPRIAEWEKQQTARRLAESEKWSYADSDDPSGNWGFQSDRLQMSVRFDQSEYSFKDKITAIILIRNTSSETVSFPYLYAPRGFELVIVDNEKNLINRLDGRRGANDRGAGSDIMEELPAYTQIAYRLPLQDAYVFSKPGNHFIYAKVQLWLPKERKKVSLMSGNAMINLIDRPVSLKPAEFNPLQLLAEQRSNQPPPSVPPLAVNQSPLAPGQVDLDFNPRPTPSPAPRGALKTLPPKSEHPSAPNSAAGKSSSALAVTAGGDTKARGLWFIAICLMLGGCLALILLRAARRRHP